MLILLRITFVANSTLVYMSYNTTRNNQAKIKKAKAN